MAAAVHTSIQGHMKLVQVDLQQEARDFHIPEFSPPWSHQLHPSVEEASKAADNWALHHFRTLVGSQRFSKIMEANISTLLSAGIYSTGPVWGLEFGMQYILFLFVLDDEVLHQVNQAAHETGVAQIFLELLLVMMSSFPREKVLEEALERVLATDENLERTTRDRIDQFLAHAVQHPGTVDYSDELGTEVSPITSAFRDLWKRATSVMPVDWSQRFAYISQRDMLAMFKEAHDQKLGLTPNSISEYILQRREYGFGESTLVVGELTEGIHVSNAIYYSPPMQRLVQALNDIIVWHNDIQSFQKELLNGETVNLVYLISKKEGCSHNRAAEIVNGMVVDRCKDLSLAAADLRSHADSKEESYLDSENTEKYVLLCTNFVSATHCFHSRSPRFNDIH